MADTFYATLELKILGWTVSCSVFWVNIDTTRYSATEFGGNKPTNFRVNGTLSIPVFQGSGVPAFQRSGVK